MTAVTGYQMSVYIGTAHPQTS